ncbi:unnamed protein product, partial [Mesorhabditis belari]|uniref:Biogenesis of lysosome-related organelles complex 1 subunit 7 n=1 Tax=Mesorhabditis belari TaxID=2138241 RepID=A0AAF3JB67_9BILA
MSQEKSSPIPSPDEVGGGSEMAAGIMAVIQPSVQLLDSQIVSTKRAQAVLAEKIQDMADLLHNLGEEPEYDLDVYTRKIDDSKRRITNAGSTLEKIHDRLSKLQREIARQVHKEKTEMTAPAPAPPKR